MAALDFPASPATNQTYSGPGGVVWVWDGAKWVSGTGSTVYAPVTSPVFLGNPTAPNPPAGDADTSVATTQFVAAAVGTALHDTGRNLLHNPLFNVAQRGGGPWTTTGYTADRWLLATSLDVTSLSIAPLSDGARVGIGDEQARSCLQTTVAGNAGAGSYTEAIQYIESVVRLANKTITLSFWATASVAGMKYGIGCAQIFGTGGSPSAAVALPMQVVTLSTSWARYSVTFNVPSMAGKTLGTAGNDNTQFQFVVSSGATNFPLVGVQSATVQMWGVQLEIGSVATPLEKPDPRYDLANCQRFYQVVTVLCANTNSAAVQVITPMSFPVQMRATPTMTLSSNANTNMGVPAFAATLGIWWVSSSVTASGPYTQNAAATASADL